MNLFDTSHALVAIEDEAEKHGISDYQMVIFFMWLSDDKFPGRALDDAFVKLLLGDMKNLAAEWQNLVQQAIAEEMGMEVEPW